MGRSLKKGPFVDQYLFEKIDKLNDHGRQHIFDGSKNFKETLLWLTKSAEQGHADAQFVVGEYHQSGFGTPYSATEAKKWYALAAKQGHREAKKRLTWYGFLWAYY